jgi:hypothetical protein
MSPSDQPEPVLVALTRIEGKIDLANAQLGSHNRQLEDHEARLRKLQDGRSDYVTKASARWWFSSLVALIGAVTVVLGLILHN